MALVALASLLSRGQAGLDAYLVTVEVHLAGGLPGFAVTGLPAGAVRESKDRVRAALASSGYSVPVSRITAHLGPADIPKQGGRFDLPIALGVIMADRQARWRIGALEFLGELALNGDLRPITGALPAVLAAQKEQVLIIASSDMNHYESDAITRVKDHKAIEKLLARDARGLYEVVVREDISMCGFGPAVAMLAAAGRLGATSAELVKYATSGDISGDRSAVVGYAGVIVS